MRSAILFVALAGTTASATGASWPIFTDVKYPSSVSAAGGKATVTVTVGQEATDLRIEVYGIDGMTVEPANKLVQERKSLKPGEAFTFEVTFHPPDGRSYIATNASAKFGKTGGNSVRDFPYGAQSAAQVKEHSRCVRQDPEGRWIRLPDCDEKAPPAAAAPEGRVTVSSVRAAKEGEVLRLTAFVLEVYRCPPCPDGAMCKPCMMESAVFLADAAQHPQFDPNNPPADVVAVGVDEPSAFPKGARVTFDVEVRRRAGPGGVDAKLKKAWPETKAP